MKDFEITDCPFNHQFAFLTNCLGRVKDLYALFEKEIEDDDFDYALKFKDASAKIDTFYGDCLDIIFDSKDCLNANVTSFYLLAPSYEEYTTVYATVATQIALMCTSIGEFYESKNVELIGEVSMNVDEVINIIRSMEYNRRNSGDDPWYYAARFLEIEYANRIEILEAIDNQNLSKEQFLELVDKYAIKV